MRLLLKALIFFAIFLLVACATPPKSADIQSANYGERPSQDEMISAVKNYMSKVLYDPYSAVYSCGKIGKSWVIAGAGEGNVEFGKTYFGYVSICTINAKNQLGGYTGEKEYIFMIYGKNGTTYRFAHFDSYQLAGDVHASLESRKAQNAEIQNLSDSAKEYDEAGDWFIKQSGTNLFNASNTNCSGQHKYIDEKLQDNVKIKELLQGFVAEKCDKNIEMAKAHYLRARQNGSAAAASWLDKH